MDRTSEGIVVCRLCDNDIKVPQEAVSIFEKDAAGRQVLRHIRQCLSIVIYRTDPLSKYVCRSCFNSVEKYNIFRKLVETTSESNTERLLQNGRNTSDAIRLYLSNFDHDDEVSISRSNQSTSTEDFILPDESSTLDVDASSCCSEMMTNNSYAVPVDDSDMELEEDEAECRFDMSESNKRKNGFSGISPPETPPTKRIRVVGPRSAMELQDAEDDPIAAIADNSRSVRITRRVHYEPHTLLQSCLNHFNALNVSDYYYERCQQIVDVVEEWLPYCQHCDKEYTSVAEMAAKHTECRTLRLALTPVDELKFWPVLDRDAVVRNEWLREWVGDDAVQIREAEYGDLLVEEEAISVDDTIAAHGDRDDDDDDTMGGDDDYASGGAADAFDGERDEDEDLPNRRDSHNIMPCRVKYIDMVPFVDENVRLEDIGRKERAVLYQTVRLQNTARKFCQLCRFTYKDNWAMDKHYTSLACYYTCRYCGRRFNQFRDMFDEHIARHIQDGHKYTKNIYASSKRYDTMPRLLNPKLVRFIAPDEIVSRKTRNSSGKFLPTPVAKSEPSTKSMRLKSLLEQTPSADGEPIIKRGDGSEQAYFCKKCYKVFFKVSEFSSHQAVCTGLPGTLSARRIAAQLTSPSSGLLKAKEEAPSPPPAVAAEEDDEDRKVFSPTGRPVRHCARGVRTYNDDIERIDISSLSRVTASTGTFDCGICSAVFSNVHSRNSHMRVHKTGSKTLAAKFFPPKGSNNPTGVVPPMPAVVHNSKPIGLVPPAYANALKYVKSLQNQKQLMQQHQRMQQQQQQQQQKMQQQRRQGPPSSHYGEKKYQAPNAVKSTSTSTSSSSLSGNDDAQQHRHKLQSLKPHRPQLIKQEPMEPLVEIHEEDHNHQQANRHATTSIGSISITPIGTRTRSSESGRGPDILRLVQSNPNITLQPKSKQEPLTPAISHTDMGSSNSSPPGSVSDVDRSYRCSSCTKPFANKSHLYFHKKTSCVGSKYPCPFCKKRFGSESAYSAHIYYSHPV